MAHMPGILSAAKDGEAILLGNVGGLGESEPLLLVGGVRFLLVDLANLDFAG